MKPIRNGKPHFLQLTPSPSLDQRDGASEAARRYPPNRRPQINANHEPDPRSPA